MRYRITVKAIVLIEDRILLLRKPQGLWDLPGGRLEDGEHPEECIRREVREETGLQAEPVMIVDCFDRETSLEDPVFITMYLCDVDAEADDVSLSREHTEAGLFHPSELDALNMYPSYRESILRYVERGLAVRGKRRLSA
jgi:8-oxo-dGTP pyrophosphatase MutT (NUDIX family)